MIRRLTKAERAAKAKRQARHRRLYRKSPLGKGPAGHFSEHARKAWWHVLEVAQIAETREKVWARTHCCELTGKPLVGGEGELHEDPPRSLTRGLPPDQRFNERVCCRASTSAHADQTEHRAWVDFADPVQRFLGAYTVRRWADDAVIFRQSARLTRGEEPPQTMSTPKRLLDLFCGAGILGMLSLFTSGSGCADGSVGGLSCFLQRSVHQPGLSGDRAQGGDGSASGYSGDESHRPVRPNRWSAARGLGCPLLIAFGYFIAYRSKRRSDLSEFLGLCLIGLGGLSGVSFLWDYL